MKIFENPRALFTIFGISILAALIGIATAIFGAAKASKNIVYIGLSISVFSFVFSIYSKIMLKKLINKRYGNLTSHIDSEFKKTKDYIEKIYSKKVLRVEGDQKTNPDNGKEQ